MEKAPKTYKDYAPFIRLIVMGISFVATAMTTMFNWNPLPWSDDQVTQGLTVLVTVGISIYNWFKNQPVTSYGKKKEEVAEQHLGTRQEFKGTE